jgi:heptosyltransferase-2
MRVLVVQTGFLGDQVLSTPLARELRRRHPAAEIALVTTPPLASLLASQPWIDAVHVHVKRPGLASLPRAARLGRRLARERFDVALVAHRSHRSALIARISRAPRRVGFAGAPGAWGYTERIVYDRTRHACERYLSLLAPLGCDPSTAAADPCLVVPRRATERARDLLAAHEVRAGETRLCIAPGSVWPTKRWTEQGFAAVAREAAARGMRPVLVGSADDAPLCSRIAAGAAGGAVSVAGLTTVDELAGVLQDAAALVGNDSGPAHLAAAVGTPTVTVFGATAPALGYVPRGSAGRIVEEGALACRPCSRHGGTRCPLGHFRCMRDVGPERVLRALDELLEEQRPQSALARPPG